ncbi:dephospho-CoA kinase-domain-containing protein [Dunaliella salina]|uniref:Dephospho-CoA kinase-domain-containing protein n=1 Tax=Dunaliella salina TaxID=3046 RepID=A0ABQ7H3F7_DUNSA|nr:dephospho-CoA kinase-domain-containing protein [Dunaliella salina]|eukprot:KAF5841355.1 dephospho-CoA kinase-domain-containing protein [Dunaliella salina]
MAVLSLTPQIQGSSSLVRLRRGGVKSRRGHMRAAPQCVHHGQHESASKPFTLALTGSIGMGKSTVASMIKRRGVPVLGVCVVHRLYAPGGAAVQPIQAHFSSAVKDGAVDRQELSKVLMADKGALTELEEIVHPLVAEDRRHFLADQAAAGTPLVCLDIPLLFEKGLQHGMDAILVVSASPEQQKQRVLARPGMTLEKFQAILSRQVPDTQKREQATHVINTSTTLEETEQQVSRTLQELLEMHKARVAS